MQPGTSENVRDFVASEHWAKRFQLLYDVTHEIRITIDTLWYLNGRLTVVHSVNPIDDRLDGKHLVFTVPFNVTQYTANVYISWIIIYDPTISLGNVASDRNFQVMLCKTFALYWNMLPR